MSKNITQKLEEYFKKRHEEEEKQERELKRSKAKDGEHDNGSEVIEEMSLKTDVEQSIWIKLYRVLFRSAS